MDRRAFFGAFGAVLAAAALPLTAKFQAMPDAMIWSGDSFVTPNGENITSLQKVFGELYVFTPSSVYVITERQAARWAPATICLGTVRG